MEKSQKFDPDLPVKICDGIYWIGYYDKGAGLHCNPYLLIDEQEVVLIDPGSIPHFPIVARKIVSIVNPELISAIVVTHPDPDICACLAVIEDIINNKNLIILGHRRSNIFVPYYGSSAKLYNVEEHDYQYQLKSGRSLRFIFTPYLHSPGAVVMFDQKTGVLFSSDIFGSYSEKEWQLLAPDNYHQQIKEFHQDYIPSKYILRPFLDALKQLDIKLIAPQHGCVFQGDMISKCIDTLYSLDCGVDGKKS